MEHYSILFVQVYHGKGLVSVHSWCRVQFVPTYLVHLSVIVYSITLHFKLI